MRATLVIARNPFEFGRDRELITLRRRVRLSTLARRHRIDPNRPWLCCLNGEYYLRREWRRTVVEDGATVAFVLVPKGRGKSNPLAIVLTIGLALVAGPIAGAILGPGVATASTLFQVARGAIFLGGSMLVSALLPPPRAPTPQIQAALAAPSPTYSLQGQGNVARLGQPIPLAYGRNRLIPDLAADPYADFPSGNDQVLYQLYCLGHGRFSFEQILIEDTIVAQNPTYGTFAGLVFPDLTFELVPPGGTVTLFPAEVVTSAEVAGQRADHNIALGPFVVNPAGADKRINAIGIDSIMPRGSYFANDAGGIENKTTNWRVEAQEIDDGGFPLGGWVTLGNETLTAATTTPQRVSHRYTVATGRYQVRYTRTNAEDASSRAGHELLWFGLRGYCPGSQQYGQVTMLAMRARASNAMSVLASRQLKVICTRMLPVRINGAWQPEQATRSIAWAGADMCRAPYAGELLDTDIAWGELDALDVVWTSRGDTFDLVFDGQQDFLDGLGIILRAGRAKAFPIGSRMHFWRHQPQALPTQLLTMRNTLPGSFTREYITVVPDESDCVEIEYWDETTWAPDSVTCALPESTTDRPARLKLPGVGQRAQARREGMYMAAMHRYARLRMGIATELEGQINVFGDLVALSNVRLRRSLSGDVVAYSGESGGGLAAGAIVELSEEVEFAQGQQHYIVFRDVRGAPLPAVPVSPGQSPNHVVLGAAVAGWLPYVGTAKERTHFAFGAAGNYYQMARVETMRPRGGTVELALVNEDDRMHTADGGAPPGGGAPGMPLPPVPTVPVIPAGSLKVTLGGTSAAPVANISWAPAPGATRYLIEVSSDAVKWTRIAEPTDPPISIGVPAGDVWIRVAPVGSAQGPWVVTFVSVAGIPGTPIPAPTPTGLIAFGLVTGVLLTWDVAAAWKQFDGIQILRGTVNDVNAALVIDTPQPGPAAIYFDATGTTGVQYYYWIRFVVRGQPGPASTVATAVTGRVSKTDTTWSDSGNQVQNSDFANASLANWAFGAFGGSTANCTFGVDLAPQWTLQGGHTAYAAQANADPNTIMDLACERLSCQPGVWVEAAVWCGVHRCAAQVLVAWFDASGNLLSAPLIGQNAGSHAGGSQLAQYIEIWGVVQAPPNTATAALLLRKLGTSPGQVDSYAFWTHPQLRIATSAAQTEHSPYTPGPTGSIKGDLIPDNEIRSSHIPDDTILARHILAAQITAGKLAANALVAGDAVMVNAYVDTLKIKNQAVTIESSSYTHAVAEDLQVAVAGFVWYWHDAQLLSIVSDGIGAVQVRGHAQYQVILPPGVEFQYTIGARILRDGVEIHLRDLAPNGFTANLWHDLLVELSDGVLAAGNHDYKLQVGLRWNQGGAGTPNIWVRRRYRYMFLKEGKR